ncbi:sigma factor-like helix-turn-helix DNA-binding protein [Dysosmobacter sp.]
MDFYISLLELRHREVIEKIYMQGKSKERVASELGLTSRTVQNLRRKAVEDLAEMCRFAAEGE